MCMPGLPGEPEGVQKQGSGMSSGGFNLHGELPFTVVGTSGRLSVGSSRSGISPVACSGP